MKVQHSLKVSLHGMDNRMRAMLTSYLELNCKGIAYVVDESEAEAEIVDADLSQSKDIVQERLTQEPAKPIIVMSLYEVSSKRIAYVQKPIVAQNLINAINRVKESFVEGKFEKIAEKKNADEMPVLPLLLKKNQQTALKKSETPPEPELNKKDSISEQPSVNREKVTKDIESEEKSNVADIVTINSERPRPEIDKFLKEFDRSIQKNKAKKKTKKKPVSAAPNNRRNTIRYVFQSISGSLKKDSLLGFNPSLPVSVQAISSKGALIQIEKKLKVSKGVTLEIELDSKHFFTIPATVVRQNSPSTYGLSFLNYQHGLTEYLIGSGRKFNIK